MADDEEAVLLSPGPASSTFPGTHRYSLTGVHARFLGEEGSAGADSCSKAEVGAPWESPGPRTDGPGLAIVSCVSRSLTQSVTQDSIVKPLLQQRLLHSHCLPGSSACSMAGRAVGNMAHAPFSRSVLSGHVSERYALGQTNCCGLTASCHAVAPARRIWARPKRPFTTAGVTGKEAQPPSMPGVMQSSLV